MWSARRRDGRRENLVLAPVFFVSALLLLWAPPTRDASPYDRDVAAVRTSAAINTAMAPARGPHRAGDKALTDALTEIEDSEDDSDCDPSSRPCADPHRAARAVVHRLPDNSIPAVPVWLAAFPARAPPSA